MKGVALIQALVMVVLVALIAAAVLRLNLGSRMISRSIQRANSDRYLAEAARNYAAARWRGAAAPATIDTNDSSTLDPSYSNPSDDPLRKLACCEGSGLRDPAKRIVVTPGTEDADGNRPVTVKVTPDGNCSSVVCP